MRSVLASASEGHSVIESAIAIEIENKSDSIDTLLVNTNALQNDNNDNGFRNLVSMPRAFQGGGEGLFYKK